MRKRSKYEIIARTHHFVPVVVETSGAFGTEALELFTEIARRVRSPAVWQCRISVGVNGLCLTSSVRPCDRISSSFKIGTYYRYIHINVSTTLYYIVW